MNDLAVLLPVLGGLAPRLDNLVRCFVIHGPIIRYISVTLDPCFLLDGSASRVRITVPGLRDWSADFFRQEIQVRPSSRRGEMKKTQDPGDESSIGRPAFL